MVFVIKDNKTNASGVKELFLFLILFGNVLSLFCQDYDYVKSINQKDIYYTVKGGEKRFQVYDKNGQKEYSGSYTALVEGDMFFGTLSKYRDESILNLPKGSIVVDYTFNCINGKLNGLHYIGGHDYDVNQSKFKYNHKSDYVAVVNNHIIGSSFENTNRRPNNKANLEAVFALDYRLVQQLGKEKSEIYMTEGLERYEEDMYYDLELMIKIFLEDFAAYIDDFSERLKLDVFRTGDNSAKINEFQLLKRLLTEPNAVYSTFEELERGTIAVSLGKNNNDKIIIKVNPDSWLAAEPATRWYILYHELGHDVLNLNHGQGGRMMFNYPTKQYGWHEFFEDRKNMFTYIIKKVYPQYDGLFGY